MANFYRRSFGPGWALVGDAGYHKDATTAQGISDAFRDAEALAGVLDVALSGRARYTDALAGYQAERDRLTLPMYELTLQLASFEAPPPEVADLLETISQSPRMTEDFLSTIAGTMAVPDFFGQSAPPPQPAAFPVEV